MRERGWTGGRMEEHRRVLEQKRLLAEKRKEVQDNIGRILGIGQRWWGDPNAEFSFSDQEEDEEDEDLGEYDLFLSGDHLCDFVSPLSFPQTPSPDYTSMLVFAPHSLPDIFQTLITDFQPTLRNAEPANALYMLARFACLNCDDNWLEDLIIGATDTIEETFFVRRFFTFHAIQLTD